MDCRVRSVASLVTVSNHRQIAIVSTRDADDANDATTSGFASPFRHCRHRPPSATGASAVPSITDTHVPNEMLPLLWWSLFQEMGPGHQLRSVSPLTQGISDHQAPHPA